jgi:hypothetical protein
MLTKDNVTIGIEWRFGPDWPVNRPQDLFFNFKLYPDLMFKIVYFL